MRLFGFEIIIRKTVSWKSYAKAGRKIDAIRTLRSIANKDHPSVDDPNRMGLREAYDIVTSYMAKKGYQCI